MAFPGTSSSREAAGSRRPGITAVVPVRNGAPTIGPCLKALFEVLPPGASEVIVVDNGSTDDTLSIVGQFPARVIKIDARYVSSNRNVGAAAGQFDRLAFVDADCVIQPGWVEAAIGILNDPAVAICGDRYRLRPDATWVERAWDEAHDNRPSHVSDVEYVPGGNLATRWATFAHLGGFDEAIETGEDMDLCIRAIQSVGRVAAVPGMRMVHLGEPRTLTALAQRNAWHGRGARFFYANGRLCVATIATLVFAVSLLVGVLVVPAAIVWRQPLWLAAVLGVLVVPAAYAARYASGGWSHAARLLPLYVAYFAGRAHGLVSARLRPGKSQRHGGTPRRGTSPAAPHLVRRFDPSAPSRPPADRGVGAKFNRTV